MFRSLLLLCLVLAPSVWAQKAVAISEIAVFPEREAQAAALAANESRIAAEVPGQILELIDSVGAAVAMGAVVARIDPKDHELAVARARAALLAARARQAQAEAQLSRAKDLHARDFISADALVSRETEVAVLRAEVSLNEALVASAERSLAKTVVRAPFSAVLRVRLAQIGELAAPGTPLVTLVEVGRVEISAQVQLRDVASLKSAPVIRFVSAGQTVEAALLRVSPVVGRESRTVEARLRPRQPVAAGTEGHLAWREKQPHIPADFLQRREGKVGIYLAEGERFVPLQDAQEGRPAALPADIATGAKLLRLPPLPGPAAASASSPGSKPGR